MKLINDETCSFCKSNKESLVHVFLECEYVKDFWSSLQLFWNTHTNSRVTLDTTGILFGFPSRFRLLNHFLLLGKRHIFLSSLHGNNLSIDTFTNNLKQICAIERFNANKNNETLAFENKWSVLSKKL